MDNDKTLWHDEGNRKSENFILIGTHLGHRNCDIASLPGKLYPKRKSLTVPLYPVMTKDPFSISILGGPGLAHSGEALRAERPGGAGAGPLFLPSVSDQHRPGPQEEDRV